MSNLSKKKGFTLIEIFLSITIIGIILGMTAPVYSQFLKRNDLSIAGEATLGGLRRASSLAVAGIEDDDWGVNVDNGGVIIFKGNDFSGRDVNFDEVQDFSPNIIVSGIQQIIFSKLSGLPSDSGTITIENNAGNSRNITINEEGSFYLQ